MAQQRRRPAGKRQDPSRRRDQRPPRQPVVGADLAALRAQLRTVVGPVVSAAGYDLEGLSVSRVGRRHLVRITVDGDEGVNLDTVADLSREISAALDAAEAEAGDLVAGEYELEVSSPGIDRPLTQPRHWRRNTGRLVKVTVGDRSIVGRVTAADDVAVTLDVDGQTRALSYPELGPGRVQIEFNRAAEIDDADLDEIDDEEEEGDDEE
jgi:ribosome maturation factor RimP